LSEDGGDTPPVGSVMNSDDGDSDEDSSSES